jgi:glucose-6-phosphate 1-epimerase
MSLQGNGDLQKVIIAHPSGATAEVYLLGAHVTSFKTRNGNEILFLSSKATFKDGKAIRGGIPVM